jgi:hypothetical protein
MIRIETYVESSPMLPQEATKKETEPKNLVEELQVLELEPTKDKEPSSTMEEEAQEHRRVFGR